MPKRIEIDEEELVRHQNLARTVSTIMANPDARVLVEQAVKKQWPEAKTPALDELKARQDLTSGVESKLDKFLEEQRTKEAKQEQDAKLNQLMKRREDGISTLRKQGWRDSAVKAVETLMDEKGILDPADAAAIYEKQNPPETLMQPGSTGAWNFMETAIASDEADADLKKLIETKGANDMIADTMARKALQEFRGQGR